jgi:hypothetical protein
MTMLCGSATHVTIFGKDGARDEKVSVPCLLDDAHPQDHRGCFGAMPITWPRDPSVTVFQMTGDGPLDTFTSPTNAACVIKVKPSAWATKQSNPIDDIRAATERLRIEHAAGPRRRDPVSQAEYDRIGALLSRLVARLPPLEPDPFPIEDAGPHPKDEA